MKKLILLFFVCLSLGVNAQNGDTLYFQNFENYKPGDMIMIDNDSLTPHFKGLETWAVSNGKAVSSSYLTNGDKTADDWMITPVIDLSTNPMLLWKAYTPDAQYREGYQVWITTDVDNPKKLTSYTKLMTIAQENPEWTQRHIDLSQYAGQKVRLAWQNNSTDEYLLYVDDILIYNQKNLDLYATKAFVPIFSKAGDPINIGIKILNYGKDNISNFNIAYKINNEPPVIESKNIPLVSENDTTIYFNTKFTPNKDSIYDIKAWVFSPNGQTDQADWNDTIFKKISIWSQGAQNKILLEHFTQASCGPCAANNPFLNSLLQNNAGKYVHIAYHTSWPGYDPMYNFNKEESDSRVKYYGVSGVPDVIVNGTNDVGSPANVTQELIDQNYQKNSPVKIDINCNKIGDSVFVNVILIPYTYFTEDVKAKVVFTETKNYSYAPGSNGEKDFPDVMRQMLPDNHGTTLSNLSKGDSVKINLLYILPQHNEVNFSNSKIAVFIQNDKTKEVYATNDLSLTSANNITESNNNLSLNIYPNPATNFISLNMAKKRVQKVEIYNTMGKLLIKKSVNNISNITINTSTLNSGIYFIKVFSKNKTYSSKFTIIHN